MIVEFPKLFNRCISGLEIYDDQTKFFFFNLPPKVRSVARTAFTAFRAASRRIVRRRRRRHLEILTAYRLLCKKMHKKEGILYSSIHHGPHTDSSFIYSALFFLPSTSIQINPRENKRKKGMRHSELKTISSTALSKKGGTRQRNNFFLPHVPINHMMREYSRSLRAREFEFNMPNII